MGPNNKNQTMNTKVLKQKIPIDNVCFIVGETQAMCSLHWVKMHVMFLLQHAACAVAYLGCNMDFVAKHRRLVDCPTSQTLHATRTTHLGPCAKTFSLPTPPPPLLSLSLITLEHCL